MNVDHNSESLHRIDLNLLVALDALARERNVTRAAERAGVSQSAMSHTLRRLRELFGDPLLVRGRGGMVLTPRAEALVVPLRSGLVSLARTVADPRPFEPSETQRTFRVVSPDLFDTLVLPALLQRLEVEAPGVDLSVVPTPTRLADGLETGDVDLAIHPVLLGDKPFPLGTQVDAELQRRTLFKDTFRCFVRAGHPALSSGLLSVESYVASRHVLVSPLGEGPGAVDGFLQADGHERRVALRVPHFATALEVVAQSDLVLTGPASLAQTASAAGVVSCPLPLEVPPHAITMMWHLRFTEDPAHRWFRDAFVDVTGALETLPH
ncbi:MAG: LysR family transcriptional regulator [Myxococcota bacterium]